MAKNSGTSDYVNVPKLQVTPAAPMPYIHIVTPDRYKLPDGSFAPPKYSVTLRLDSKDPVVAAYLKALNDLNDTVGNELIPTITKDRKSYRIKDICKAEEDDDGNETGFYLLKATSKNKPVIKDSANNIMSDAAAGRAFSGSTGRIVMSFRKSIDTQRKTVGLVLYLEKVQLISIVEGASCAADFTSVPGGFVAAPEAPDFDSDGTSDF